MLLMILIESTLYNILFCRKNSSSEKANDIHHIYMFFLSVHFIYLYIYIKCTDKKNAHIFLLFILLLHFCYFLMLSLCYIIINIIVENLFYD